ncbi:MAG: hypothetical protein ACKOB0_02035 [Chthoniobacterales bacterium]
MLSPRVIPTLLLKDMGLVKGVGFKDHKYVGDPIACSNRIFWSFGEIAHFAAAQSEAWQ